MRDLIDARHGSPALPRGAAGACGFQAAPAGAEIGQALKIFLPFCAAFLAFLMMFLSFAGCAVADMALPPGFTLLDGGAYLL